MTNLTIDTRPTRSSGIVTTLVPVHAGRSRVMQGSQIIGHLDELGGEDGARYRALRYRRASGTLISLGDFCRKSDAIDALRFAR